MAGFRTRPEMLDALVEQVRSWIDEGVDPIAIGVAARTNRQVEAAKGVLDSAGLTTCLLPQKDLPSKPGVRLGTMHRMKGLEYERVAVSDADDASVPAPDELDRHRIGLQAARRDRVNLFVESAERLLVRMEAAANTANSKVLLNPIQSPAVIKASNSVVEGVGEFHGLLEIEASLQSAEARKWKHAASETWDTTFERGAAGIGTVKTFGGDTFSQAKSATGKLSGKLSGRKLRRRGSGDREGDGA